MPEQNFDLTSMPVVIEVFPKDQQDYIELSLDGPERAKLVPMSIAKTVAFVMENYERGSLPDSMKAELDEIMAKGEVVYRVYGHNFGVERDDSGKVVRDLTQTGINDSRFFRKKHDPDQVPYWRCEIRVYEAGDHDLGGLEKDLTVPGSGRLEEGLRMYD
jgi:hypothetical protein